MVKHRSCCERETSRDQAAQERIGRDSRSCIERVRINEEVDTLLEDNVEACSDESCRNDARWPRYGWISGPTEPEQADGKENATYAHRQQPCFRHLW